MPGATCSLPSIDSMVIIPVLAIIQGMFVGVQNTFVGSAMSLFAIIMVLLLVSRGLFVFPILAAHNYWAKERLPFRQMVVAWCVPFKFYAIVTINKRFL